MTKIIIDEIIYYLNRQITYYEFLHLSPHERRKEGFLIIDLISNQILKSRYRLEDIFDYYFNKESI